MQDKNTKDLLKEILERLDKVSYIKPEDIPQIDLYMDQVTTFMDSGLRSISRNPEQDKVLTKTMINNYAKNDLLPPPVKKKYSKEHLMLLIFIYYFKGVLSIGDIQTLLHPITERFFGTDEAYTLDDIYQEALQIEKDQMTWLKKDLIRKYRVSEKTFADAPTKDQEFLQMFGFICMLSFDVYMKKLIIEKMVDSLAEHLQKDEKDK